MNLRDFGQRLIPTGERSGLLTHSRRRKAMLKKERERNAHPPARSVSDLIEVMADERWKRLAEQQGVAYAKTVAEAMKLNLEADNQQTASGRTGTRR